jgi:hypothetical protein
MVCVVRGVFSSVFNHEKHKKHEKSRFRAVLNGQGAVKANETA